MTFLMYGAGSIGRGFIGPLFARAGYEVVFVDIDANVVNALNERGRYEITIAADPPYDEKVEGVRAISGADRQAVLDAIASCGLMATALGASALQRVAPLIADGFSLRMKRGGRPLNILICENLKDAAQILRGWIESGFTDDGESTPPPSLDGRCGLIEAAIGRMIPPAAHSKTDPLHLIVEEYGFLPVDKAAFIGEPPICDGLIPFSPFAFYEERKLYLHNMGHAVCAYLGMRYGHESMNQAMSDPTVRLFTQSAMTESAAMLSIKYGVPFNDIYNHAEDLMGRFGNPVLGDTCERVGRDPMRKLKAGDRLSGALGQCLKTGVIPVFIALGYAAALRNVTEDGTRAEEIARTDGKLDDSHVALVIKLYGLLHLPAGELYDAVERVKKEIRGYIV